MKQQNVAEGLELILNSSSDKTQAMSVINDYASKTPMLIDQDTIHIANLLFTGDDLKSVLYRLTLELRYS